MAKKKNKTHYVCEECGYDSPKFFGLCPECGEGLGKEFKESSKPKSRLGGYAGAIDNKVYKASEVESEKRSSRVSTGIGELDRVLGGGLVTDSVNIISGPPGIGKSTLLIKVATSISSLMTSMYISGEESLKQIVDRGKRLNLNLDEILLYAETNVENIIQRMEENDVKFAIIDSIQTIESEDCDGEKGGAAQLKHCTHKLTAYCKEHNIALFIVGHITKDGSMAGPKQLEHIIDASLSIEGDENGRYRLLRAAKNRFGEVNEVGVFAMTDKGMVEVKNPSKIFLSNTGAEMAGSVILVSRDGTRPILFEVQALVCETNADKPLMVTSGLPYNKINLILAILRKHMNLSFFHDVFFSVVGGIDIPNSETGAHLASAFAIMSSYYDRPIPNNVCFFGEMGLTGEIRPVPNGEDRIKEAAKHGFEKIVVPKGNVSKGMVEKFKEIEIITVSNVMDVQRVFDDIAS